MKWAFSGISTFAHLKHVRCLTEPDVPFDIGIIGAPFDTAVSYRPGRFIGHISSFTPMLRTDVRENVDE